jgi:hypothetical protein
MNTSKIYVYCQICHNFVLVLSGRYNDMFNYIFVFLPTFCISDLSHKDDATTLSIMTLGIMALSITTFTITINETRHSA